MAYYMLMQTAKMAYNQIKLYAIFDLKFSVKNLALKMRLKISIKIFRKFTLCKNITLK